MHDPGTADNRSRLVRQDLLTAELEAGFALLRAATESRTATNREFEARQMDEARRALASARVIQERMQERDSGRFTARIAELSRAIEAADRPGRTLKAGG